MINKNWSFRRGDIYLADLGEHHGHIQGGTRPVVVVQNDYGNRFAPTLIVVPLTAEIKKTDMPTHYVLRHQRGLDKPCMALAEHEVLTLSDIKQLKKNWEASQQIPDRKSVV